MSRECSCSRRHRQGCPICGEWHSTSYVGASWTGPEEPSCLDEHMAAHREAAKPSLFQRVALRFGPQSYRHVQAQSTGDVLRHAARFHRPMKTPVPIQRLQEIRARAERKSR